MWRARPPLCLSRMPSMSSALMSLRVARNGSRGLTKVGVNWNERMNPQPLPFTPSRSGNNRPSVHSLQLTLLRAYRTFGFAVAACSSIRGRQSLGQPQSRPLYCPRFGLHPRAPLRRPRTIRGVCRSEPLRSALLPRAFDPGGEILVMHCARGRVGRLLSRAFVLRDSGQHLTMHGGRVLRARSLERGLRRAAGRRCSSRRAAVVGAPRPRLCSGTTRSRGGPCRGDALCWHVSLHRI